MLAILRQRNFSLLWLGGLISMLGDWALITALPFYVYARTGSTLASGAMMIASIAPGLLFGSIAGVFVDRWDRKTTLLIANVLRAPLLLLLLLARSPDMLWLVYVVAFVESSIGQFFMPAENALLPLLVGEQHLTSANSLTALNNNLARLFGAALGGLLMSLFDISSVIMIDAASYILAGLLIAQIAAPAAERGSAPATSTPNIARIWAGIWQDLRSGLRLVQRQHPLGPLFTIAGILMLADGLLSALLVVYVHSILGGDASTLGLVLMMRGLGGLLGGLLIGYLGSQIDTQRMLPMCIAIFGALLLLLFNSTSIPLALALIALVGIVAAGWQICLQVMLQANVADAYRGRVYGSYGMLSALLGLIGMVIASVLGDRIGAHTLLNISGSLDLLAALLALVLLGSAARSRAARPLAKYID